LASCQSAGDGEALQLGQGSTLATRLAEAGVPAVVAMQGLISMATIEEMMPTFFRELLRDGRIDRALAVARGEVRDHHDGWMPALFMRINDGRLWSDPPANESPERVEVRQPSGATSLETSGAVPAAQPRWPLVVGVLALVVSLILTLAVLVSSIWGRPTQEPTRVADPGPTQAGTPTAPVTAPTTPPTSPPTADLDFALVEGGPSGRPWTSTSTGMRFIALEPAVFQMGSPADEPGHVAGEQRHVVKLSQGFFIGATEVTGGQWRKLMGSNPSLCEFGCDDDQPVQNITWCDALRFLNELSKADRLPLVYTIPASCEQGGEVKWDTTVDGYRLPTEAEWEYAARAGSTTAHSFDPGAGSICSFANLGDRSASKSLTGHDFATCDDKYEFTAPVKSFPPNTWGLYDVHGNVWEWVWDRHGPYPKDPVVDPIGPSTGSDRNLRGGSFINELDDIRSAERHWEPPNFTLNRIGLRVVRGRGPS
jgi:formylglycine-generating enzyme required for sulfatase activity